MSGKAVSKINSVICYEVVVKVTVKVHLYAMVITTTIIKRAGRNVVFKAARVDDSIFERKSDVLMTEAGTVNSP